MAGLAACGAALLTLGTFSQEAAQVSKPVVSDAELDAAIQRALPGVVAVHTGSGPGRTKAGSQGRGPAALEVNMSDIPQKAQATKLPEGEDIDRPLSGLTEEQYQALKRRVAQRTAAGEIGAQRSPLAAKVGPKMLSGIATAETNSVSRGPGFFAQSENGLDSTRSASPLSPTPSVCGSRMYLATRDGQKRAKGFLTKRLLSIARRPHAVRFALVMSPVLSKER